MEDFLIGKKLKETLNPESTPNASQSEATEMAIVLVRPYVTGEAYPLVRQVKSIPEMFRILENTFEAKSANR